MGSCSQKVSANVVGWLSARTHVFRLHVDDDVDVVTETELDLGDQRAEVAQKVRRGVVRQSKGDASDVDGDLGPSSRAPEARRQGFLIACVSLLDRGQSMMFVRRERVHLHCR